MHTDLLTLVYTQSIKIGGQLNHECVVNSHWSESDLSSFQTNFDQTLFQNSERNPNLDKAYIIFAEFTVASYKAPKTYDDTYCGLLALTIILLASMHPTNHMTIDLEFAAHPKIVCRSRI